MKNYRTGLVSVSFRRNTPSEIILAAKNAELSYIEWGSDIHAPYQEREALHKIRELQEKQGIACSSYGTYFRLGVDSLDKLEGYIAAAKILGTNILRVWCSDKSGAVMGESEREHLLAECKAAAVLAKEHEVVLCTERHKDTFTEIDEDALSLLRSVDSDAFRTYWQPFQWRSAEENLKSARTLSQYTKHVHVFNWRGKERLPLSDAREEWRRYLHKLGEDHTLLLEFMPDGRIESLSREADALRDIIEG